MAVLRRVANRAVEGGLSRADHRAASRQGGLLIPANPGDELIAHDCGLVGNPSHSGIDDLERKDGDFGNYHIVDGVIVIPKNAVLYPGTVI